MRYFIFFTFCICLISSCDDPVVSELTELASLQTKNLQVTNLNGADFDFNFQEYDQNYTGSVTFNGSSMPVVMKMTPEYGSEQTYSIVKSGGNTFLKSYNPNSNQEIYFTDYFIRDGRVEAIASEQIDGETFSVSVDDPDLKSNIEFEQLIDMVSMNANNKACIPCYMVVGAAVGVVACAWATSSAADACTEAFNQSCGDAGQCCSMEFEAGNCGGDCNITCN